MPYSIEPMTKSDAGHVAAIFNHYVVNDFSAYFITAVPDTFFVQLKEANQGYPVFVALSEEGEFAGFGLIRPYHSSPVFERTAELTYFIHPDHVRKGLGGNVLGRLIEEARKMGIDRLLASISSKNEGSIAFHLKHGFVECGRLPKVGRKFDQDFDVVYMHRPV